MEVGEQESDYDAIVETLINTFGTVLSKDCLYSIVESYGGDVEQSANAVISITMDDLSLTPKTERSENILCEGGTVDINTNDAESNRPCNSSQFTMPSPLETAISYASASQSQRQLSLQKLKAEIKTPTVNQNFWTTQLKNILDCHKDGVRVLVILRGPPGSGKTYIAKKIVDAIYPEHCVQYYRTHILSTDDFFIVNGVYVFDKRQIPEAHVNNQSRATKCMKLGLSPIIIDNTNIELWEMQPYVRDGVSNGYVIEIVEPGTPWARKAAQLFKKNTHNVPLPTIKRMLDNFQSDVTGHYLIKYFGYQYPPDKTPPVLRNLPPILKEITDSTKNVGNIPIEKVKVTQQNSHSSDVNNPEQGSLSKGADMLDSQACSQSMKNDDNLENNVVDTNFSEVVKYIETVQKLEKEWENGDDWEDASVNAVKKDDCVILNESRPQRNKLIRTYMTENLLPPGEDYDDWSKISKFLPSWGESESRVLVEPTPVIEKTSSSTCVELGDTEISNTKNPFKIITATSRDINEAYVASLNKKIPERWMLDKGTDTNEILTPRCRNFEKHFLTFRKELKNISRSHLRDIYDTYCYSALEDVLDGKSKLLPHDIDSAEVSNTEEEKQNVEHCGCLSAYDILTDHNVSLELPVVYDKAVINLPSPIKKVKKERAVSEETLQLKKHIEQNIVIPDNHYSNHCLKIKKIRQGEYNGDENKENAIEDIKKKDDDNENTADNRLSDYFNIPSTSGLSELNTCNDNRDSRSSCVNANFVTSDEDYGGIDEMEKTVNIQLGVDFVRQLDVFFGRSDMEYPPSFNFNVNMPISFLNEINALWTESMSHQFELQAKNMELMLKQDEEFARELSRKQEELIREGKEPVDPEFQDVMDFDYALALYHENTAGWRDKEPADLAAKLTREKLCNLFPDINRDILFELLAAHHNNFQTTVEVLLMSIGRSDILEAENGVSKFIMKKEMERKEKLLRKEEQTSSYAQNPLLPQWEKVDMNLVQKYRDQAEKHLLARNTNYQKAQDYFRRGKMQVAVYFSDFATHHKRKYEQANSLAAASLIQIHAANKNNITIDLHFLRVAEAKESLDLFLDIHIQKLKEKQAACSRYGTMYQTLFLITGRGLHSNGKPRIKPAVMKRLTERGLFYYERNPGLLSTRVTSLDKLSYQA